MSEVLSNWLYSTRAQGDPSKYSKTDLEIYTMRLFDKFNFKAGKSNRELRRSFEELWECCDGNTEAFAYGFDASLENKVYSIAYVKACIKGFKPTAETISPIRVAERAVRAMTPVATVPKAKRKAKVTEPKEPTPDVEWS